MQYRAITIGELTASEERAWRDLAARAIEPNPFFEPDCLVPAAQHQADGARIRLMVAEEDGRFLAAVPFWFTYGWRVPYPLVTSHVRRMQYLGTPLVDGSGGTSAVAALLAGLAAERRALRGRVLFLDIVAGDGPVAGLVRDAASRLGFPVVVLDVYERGLLRRRPDGGYDQMHGSKSRRNLRRLRRQLAERFGGAPVAMVVRDDDPSALDDYVALEASGYKQRSGVAMATVPGEPEYFVDMCKRFAAAGRLHVLALEVGGETIAMEIGVRGAEGIFLMKVSYDERYRQFSPGILLQTDAMRHFHNQTDAQWIDTCTYRHNEPLLRLYPERRTIESWFVVLGQNPVDRLALRSMLAARPLHKRFDDWRGRRHLDKNGFSDKRGSGAPS